MLGTELGELCEPLSGRTWTGRVARLQAANRAAHYRSCGMGPGDLVFMHLGNRLEFFADLLAIWSLGACAAPIDPQLTAFEVETLARLAVPRFSLWSAPPSPEVGASMAALGVSLLASPDAGAGDGGPAGPAAGVGGADGGADLDRDALVLFTSGTTGQPKGVVLTHRALLARWVSLRAHVGVHPVRRTLCLLPTHFGHGLICNALYPWLSGQRLAIVAPFRSDVVLQLGHLVDDQRVTFLSSVPALWRLALRTARPPDRGTLERVFCGSAPLSGVLWRNIGTWTRARVSNVYGITEAASWLAGTAPDADPEDGLVGEPWGASIAVRRDTPGAERPDQGPLCEPDEAGHVWVRTPALMRGYLRREDLTARAVQGGWLATGDVGFLDPRGRLHLQGRRQEQVNRGGIKVYPADVDAVVERFGETIDTCAFGYDDGLGQEEVAVAVVLTRPDVQVVRRLHDWTRRHLAPYQMPRRWYVVDEIPRTSRGKVNRAQVAARCGTLRPVDLRDVPPHPDEATREQTRSGRPSEARAGDAA